MKKPDPYIEAMTVGFAVRIAERTQQVFPDGAALGIYAYNAAAEIMSHYPEKVEEKISEEETLFILPTKGMPN